MGVTPPATIRTTVIFLFFCSAFAQLEPYSHFYQSFNKSLEEEVTSKLIFENYAKIANDALQLTPDTTNNPSIFNLSNQSGRVMLRRPFTLWRGGAGDVNSTIASFNTSFLINMSPINNGIPGEGLAFLIAPDVRIPDNSYGQYLGLTNATLDGQSSNGIVAVELDTVEQNFDTDNNHIGLNIHSIVSIVSKSLVSENITLAPLGSKPGIYNVWIQYDGVEKMIRVYIKDQPERMSPTPPMPATPILEYNLDLRSTVNRNSYFGFAASTGDLIEINCVLQWNLTLHYSTEGGHNKSPQPKSPRPKILPVVVWIPVVVVVGVVALLGFLAYCFYKKRMVDRSQSNIVSRLRMLPGMPKEFRFRELKKATNNFDEKRKLGQGGYGVVYRGVLPEDNLEVAVKWFSRESLKGEGDFLAELTIINRLRHKHLVRLLGWCHKSRKLLLVYEYMQKGSLDMHLFKLTGEPLSWTLRCKILAGVASALHYLHYEYDQKVVHRDIKASNIMLDLNFNARLGDFGLARALDNEKTSYAEAEGVIGTIGYIAPECFLTGKATQYSDIYAFGALLIEVVSGQRPGTRFNGFQFMVDYVWSLYREGRILDAVDKRIVNDYDNEDAQQLLLLGLACSHPIASERPKTQEIIQMISGSMPVPSVPPFKPAFMWPAMMPPDDISMAISTDTTTIRAR